MSKQEQATLRARGRKFWPTPQTGRSAEPNAEINTPLSAE